MKYFFFIFIFFISGDTHGQIITTIAGIGGFGGFSGDGGPATAAQLREPARARSDGSGNIYIADLANNRIRKVNAAGIITTIAGGGLTLSGSGAPATAAGLSGPNSVVTDTAGNIYFSESASGGGIGPCVMKIAPGGIMVVFAGYGTGLPGSGDGGPATAAVFQNISDITLDNAGNMYVLDPGKQNLRKINAAGIISTIAGNGTSGYSGDGGPATAARLYQSEGVAADNSGNVYIADLVNNRVRKVDATGIITTIAGTGTPGYSGDGGPATAAELNDPFAVAVDDWGNVYVADAGNHRIRRITAGVITTAVGDSIRGYSGDGGSAKAAEMSFPIGVSLDDSGNMFIADEDYNVVRRVSAWPVIVGVAPQPPVKESGELILYPNPATGRLTICIPGTDEVRYEITDMPGRTVLSGTLPAGTQTIDVNTLTPGTYIISLYNGDIKGATKVFVKQ